MFRNNILTISVVLLLASNTAVYAQKNDPETKIKGIDKIIKPLMQQGKFPGVALAILNDGKPIHIGTYGMASIENKVPVTTKTVFELASLTKQMTAVAIMTLVEQGRLRLEDKIIEYIPDAPEKWHQITVDQLLSHQAGLTHRFEHRVNDVFLLEYSRAEMLESAKSTNMLSQPGTDWHYSDQGYFLLGLIIEKITQQTFADYMQTTFFEPLKMDQTHLLDQRKIVPFLAQGYAVNGGKLERNRRVWQFALTSHFGVMSSLEDMMRWEAEMASPSVISQKAIQGTWEIQRAFDTGSSCDTWGYARGWKAHVVKNHRILSHGGYAGTVYIRAVDDKFSVIVLTNREDSQEEISPFSIAWAATHSVLPKVSADGIQCWK